MRHSCTFCCGARGTCLFVAATRAQMETHQAASHHAGVVGAETTTAECVRVALTALAPAPEDDCHAQSDVVSRPVMRAQVARDAETQWRASDANVASLWWSTSDAAKQRLAQAFAATLKKYKTTHNVKQAREEAIQTTRDILAPLPIETYGSCVIGTDLVTSDVDLHFQNDDADTDANASASASGDSTTSIDRFLSRTKQEEESTKGGIDAATRRRAKHVALLIDAASALENDERFRDIETVVHSRVRVPLLRANFLSRGGETVQVSLTAGTANVLKSKAMAEVVKRLPMLRRFVQLTKLWAAARGMNDPAGAGSLNSWCWLILAYHHAASVSHMPTIVPPLDELLPCDNLPDAEHEKKWLQFVSDECKIILGPVVESDDDDDDDDDDEQEADNLKLVDLFTTFVARMSISREFWQSGVIVSALRGCALVRPFNPTEGTFARWPGAALAVEDPFEPDENAARTVRDTSTADMMCAEFARAASLLHHGSDSEVLGGLGRETRSSGADATTPAKLRSLEQRRMLFAFSADESDEDRVIGELFRSRQNFVQGHDWA